MSFIPNWTHGNCAGDSRPLVTRTKYRLPLRCCLNRCSGALQSIYLSVTPLTLDSGAFSNHLRGSSWVRSSQVSTQVGLTGGPAFCSVPYKGPTSPFVEPNTNTKKTRHQFRALPSWRRALGGEWRCGNSVSEGVSVRTLITYSLLDSIRQWTRDGSAPFVLRFLTPILGN